MRMTESFKPKATTLDLSNRDFDIHGLNYFLKTIKLCRGYDFKRFDYNYIDLSGNPKLIKKNIDVYKTRYHVDMNKVNDVFPNVTMIHYGEIE